MVLIALAVAASMLVGSEARRRDPRSDRLVDAALDLVLFVLLPLIALAFASRLELSAQTLIGIAGGYGVIATVGLLAWWISGRVLGLSGPLQGGIVLATVLANTGYLGLPVAATLLGRDELPDAVIWDGLISGPMALLVAPFIAEGFARREVDATVLRRLSSIVRRAPAIPALIVGLLVPASWVPDAVVDLAELAVYASLPLGFFAVGATIRRLAGGEGDRPPRAAVGLIVGLRIVAAPALFALLSVAVLPSEPRAFMLQAAMPCGINALVVSHAFDLDRGVVAQAIAVSTGVVLTAALVGGLVL